MIKRRNLDSRSLVADIGEWLSYDLTAGIADAFAIAVQNPYDYDVIIDRALIYTTTAGGTGSSVGNLDVVASATATGDDIFDGVDLNATAIYDSLNAADNGTNGEGKSWVWDEKNGTNDYLTLKILAEDASSLAGTVYIHILKT